MITSIFEWLTNLMQTSFLFAFLASLIWGILSILLSPCHLASIPLVVAFIGEQGRMTTRRAFWLATSFSLGILVTISLIGFITGLLGRMLGDIGVYGNYFVAIIFFVIGLHLLEIIEIPFFGKNNQPVFQKKGLMAAVLLGLIFGIALGPCTFAYMAPMLGIVFTISSTRFLFAVLLLIFYGIGTTLTVAAAIEQGHDDKGIIWPVEIAPYHWYFVVISKDDEIIKLAEEIYNELSLEGVEVVLDDRKVGPGFKFKDADLLGLPVMLVLGERDYRQSKTFEIRIRKDGKTQKVKRDELVKTVKDSIESLRVKH